MGPPKAPTMVRNPDTPMRKAALRIGVSGFLTIVGAFGGPIDGLAICPYNEGTLPQRAQFHRSLYARMGGKLGVSHVRSDIDLASLVEKRLPAAAIQSLVRGGLSDSEVYRLIIPRRT